MKSHSQHLTSQHVECSQDQWDIYKLDPLYECRVCAPPTLSVITRVTVKSEKLFDANAKRPADYESSQESQDSPIHPQKKIHLDLEDLSEQDDEFEVQDMVTDSNEAFTKPRSAAMSFRARQVRAEINRNRYDRRHRMDRHAEKPDQEEEMPFDPAQQQRAESQTPTPDRRSKRKGFYCVIFLQVAT